MRGPVPWSREVGVESPICSIWWASVLAVVSAVHNMQWLAVVPRHEEEEEDTSYRVGDDNLADHNPKDGRCYPKTWGVSGECRTRRDVSVILGGVHRKAIKASGLSQNRGSR